MDTQIVVAQAIPPSPAHEVSVRVEQKKNGVIEYRIPQVQWIQKSGEPINLLVRGEVAKFAKRFANNVVVDTVFKITQGAKPFQVGKGSPPQTRHIVDAKPFVAERRIDSTFRPLLRGSLISRYALHWKGKYWISLGGWLAEPRYSASYDAPAKLVIRQTGDSLVAAFDDRQFVVRDNLYTIVARDDSNLLHLLGLLNSRFLNWYYQNIINPEKGEALAQIKRGHIARLPLPPLPNKSAHDRFVTLVDQMLSLHKSDAGAKTPQEREAIARQIEAKDRQIDQLVYELYGLSDDEIRLVEETAE